MSRPRGQPAWEAATSVSFARDEPPGGRGGDGNFLNRLDRLDRGVWHLLWQPDGRSAANAAAQSVWDQLDAAQRSSLINRATYRQTDADPGLACVLADLQRQHIRRISRALRFVGVVFAALLGLYLVTGTLLVGWHPRALLDVWPMVLPILPALLFLLSSGWGYHAAYRHNEAVAAQAHKQPPSERWGQHIPERRVGGGPS